MPLVSLVTPCLNAERFLPEMLASVAAQTFTDWEHIIVDDGSTDGSAAVIERAAARDARIRLVRQPNRGLIAARTHGYTYVSPGSRYVQFGPDADDVLEPTAVARFVSHFEAHPEAVVVSTSYRSMDAEGRPIAPYRFPRYAGGRFFARPIPPSEPRTPFEAIYCWGPVMEPSSMIRRDAYARTAGWDPWIGQGGEGIDLFLQLSLIGEIHFLSEDLYRYRRHAAQVTANQARIEPQAKRVREKWLHRGPWPAGGRERAWQAERFRRGPLRARLQADAVCAYLARRQWRDAAACLRSLAGATWTVLTARASPSEP